MGSPLVRRANDATNPLHSLVYFAGWTQEEWDAGVAGLAERGLLAADGTLTAAGQGLRDRVEQDTDRMAAPPWRHLGDERTEEVITIGRAKTRAAVSAGAFPRTGVFARPR